MISSFRDRIEAASRLRKGCLNTSRVRQALASTGHETEWIKIETCEPKAYCNSSYCKSCRTRHVKRHSERLIALHREHHGDNEGKARTNLRFLTVLCSLCRPDHDEVREAIAGVRNDLTLLRGAFPGLKLQGRFEAEIVDTKTILGTHACPQKGRALRGLNGGSDMTPCRDMILLHFHALVFLNGNDPEAVTDSLRKKWPTPYAIKMDTLFRDRSIESSIHKVCSYMLKDRYQYNHRIQTNGFIDERYLSEDSLSFLIRFGLRVGNDGMLIYSH